MLRYWLLGLIIIGAIWQWMNIRGEVELGPGVMVEELPVQQLLERAEPFIYKDYRLTPLAGYRLKGKVLGAEAYRWDSGAKISPLDLAIGWGAMSDELVVGSLESYQRGRFFYWYDDTVTLSAKEINQNSSNTHIIPASDDVNDVLDRIRIGDIVELQGLLVNVDNDNGWRWRSSLSRLDEGSGACELMWVEQVVIHTEGID